MYEKISLLSDVSELVLFFASCNYLKQASEWVEIGFYTRYAITEV